MFVLARAATYAVLFVGLVLVFVPSRLLALSGITRPAGFGPFQVAGLVAAAAGAAVALGCVYTFARSGRGTPAPFDPPRRLVVRGPYRFVRNPMYLGAGLALGGAALYYRSVHLVAYLALLAVASHLFVIRYEEPVLRRTFGREYEDYCRSVRRWWPKG